MGKNLNINRGGEWGRITLLAAAVALSMLAFCSWLYAADEQKQLHVTADHLVSDKIDGDTRETTWAKMTVTQDDAKFYADNVIQRTTGKVHVFTCTGNPKFTDPENTITGDKVIVYSSPRRAEFSGNVKLVNTPKEKPKNGSEIKKQMASEPSTITSDNMSYDYAKKTALATGHVMIVQKDRTVSADQGVYEQDSEMVEMTGNISMKNAGEGELRDLKNAQTVTVRLDTDWIDITKQDGKQLEMNITYQDDTAPAGKTPAGDKK